MSEPLKLYLCVRWGHAESLQGADGEDTSFLVRAREHLEAAALADVILKWMPTQIDGNPRCVESQCHRVLELGVDCSGSDEASVLTGPLIGNPFRAASDSYVSWCRGDDLERPHEWLLTSEVFAAYYAVESTRVSGGAADRNAGKRVDDD